MAKTKEIPKASRPSAWWLFLLVPLSMGGSILVGFVQPRWLKLFVAGVVWICLRFSVSSSQRTAIAQSFRSSLKATIIALLAAFAVTPAWVFWQHGWQDTLGLFRETYGAVVIVWFSVTFTTAMAVGMVILVVKAFQKHRQAELSAEKTAETLVVVFSEAIFLGWFILALAGQGLNTGLEDISFPLQWVAAVGLLAPLFAWWEGDKGWFASRARFGMCILAALTHYEGVWTATVAAHDWLIAGPLVHAPLSLRVILPLAMLLLCGIAFFVLLSNNFLWKRATLNKLALTLLKLYFAWDPRGKWHTLVRHLGHLLAHRRSPTRWLWEGFLYLWQLLLGKLPKCFLSQPLNTQSRYERFVRARLDACEYETQQCSRAWRAAHLRAPNGAKEEVDALRVEAQRHAESLLALGDYLACPHHPCEPSLSHTTMWKLAERADRLLLAVRPLTIEGGRGSGYNNALDLVCQRLLRYYKWLQQQSINSSFRELIAFRLAILPGQKFDDLQRLTWRDQLLRWLQSNPDWGAFAVSSLLAEFQQVRDWAGLIETCRLLTIETTYVLTESEHMDLGEAYWHHAEELGDGELGQWAWEQAVSHFYEAKAKEHLQNMPAPFKEVGSNETQIDGARAISMPASAA